MNAETAKHVGGRLLGEVEEGSLEELLRSLRASLTNISYRRSKPQIPIPELSTLISRYQKATQSAPPPLLSVSGRYLPFLYHLIPVLISAPHYYTVVLVDAEHRFDVTRLAVSPSELRHIHVYRPPRGQEQVKAAVSTADNYMLYGAHGSREREWWGTIVVGGTGGDVNAGWKGWLKAEKEEVGGFGIGVSVEEALREREKRQEIVDRAGWVASSPYGAYTWKET